MKIDLYFIAETIKKNGCVGVRVEGVSMYPFLKPGGKISLESPDHIEIGDVVAYSEGGSICLHRVVRKIKTDDKISLITKGDANRVKDRHVFMDEVVGKLVMPDSRWKYLVALYSRFVSDCYAFLYRYKSYLFGESKVPLLTGLFDMVMVAPYIFIFGDCPRKQAK